MCVKRVQAWFRWFAPTRKHIWLLVTLVVLVLFVSGKAEKRRRDEVMRVTAEQVKALDDRAAMERAYARKEHAALRERIEALEAQIERLTRK